MNTSEQLYHMNDTLNFLADKIDREIRLLKNMLRKIIEHVKPKDEVFND
jgi:chromosomal replication initiation ATPase DnaA